MTRIFISAAVAALSGIAAMATAPQAHAASTIVQTADLDLFSPEGQAALEKRITTAAVAVCSFKRIGSQIRTIDAECVAQARASTERQIVARRTGATTGG